MRAKEFVINVPITIKINGDGDPEVDMQQGADDARPVDELDPDPVMIPPLQQDLELRKAEVGKLSPVIQSLTQDEEEPEATPPQRSMFRR